PPSSTLFPYTTLFRSLITTAATGRSEPRRDFRRRRDGALSRHLGSRLRRWQDDADARACACLSRPWTECAMLQEWPRLYRSRLRSEEHTSELQSPCNL